MKKKTNLNNEKNNFKCWKGEKKIEIIKTKKKRTLKIGKNITPKRLACIETRSWRLHCNEEETKGKTSKKVVDMYIYVNKYKEAGMK